MDLRKNDRSKDKAPGRSFMDKLDAIPGSSQAGSDESDRPLRGEVFRSLLDRMPAPGPRPPAPQESGPAPAVKASDPAALLFADGAAARKLREAETRGKQDLERASEINTGLDSIFSGGEEGEGSAPSADEASEQPEPVAQAADRDMSIDRQLSGIMAARELAERPGQEAVRDADTKSFEPEQPAAEDVAAPAQAAVEKPRIKKDEPIFGGQPKQTLQNFVSKIMNEIDNIFTDDGASGSSEAPKSGENGASDTVEERG